MASIQFTATVREARLLELPEAAGELGLSPGDKVTISVDRNGSKASFAPNEGMLTALAEIAVHQTNHPFTDGTNTLKLLREARGGAMYGYDPTE